MQTTPLIHSPADDLLDATEVAAWTGIAIRTLSQWRYLRRGPTYLRLGGRVRYRRSDVDAWLNANAVPAGGDR